MTSSIGESYDPLGAHLQDPYPFFALAREKEPVFYSEMLRAWVVTRFDDVHTVLQRGFPPSPPSSTSTAIGI